MKKRTIVARMTRRGSREERDFDREFWRKAGPEARFAAAWQMIDECALIRGKNVRESRLQRSVQTVFRRGR